MTASTEINPTAAGSGRSATERFAQKERAGGTVDQARVSAIATDALQALHEVIRKHQVTYAEYDALKSWLIRVGEDGEWPLFLDVWLEHVVEEVANADRKGTSGTIEGPYYVPGAPEFRERGHPADARRREGHAARCSRARSPTSTATRSRTPGSSCGTPTTTASTRSSPRASRSGTCAARSVTGADGRFAFHTIQPAPYQIPTDGSCGALIAAAGWHAWRPAHLHLKVSAPGQQLITTQLYFEGGEYVERRRRPGGQA